MTLPAWWERDGQKQNARSRRQERRHAAKEGGKVVAGSGSSWRAKEDVVTPENLDQLKYTDKASYTIRAEDMQRLFDNATAMGREGRLVVSFEEYGLTVVVTQEAR